MIPTILITTIIVSAIWLATFRALHSEIALLKADLAKAQRNDTPKDPVTGKFVKRAK